MEAANGSDPGVSIFHMHACMSSRSQHLQPTGQDPGLLRLEGHVYAYAADCDRDLAMEYKYMCMYVHAHVINMKRD